MLRAAISLVLLSACGSSARGPAWPKLSEHGADGGESLAPRKSGALAASDVTDDDEISIEPAADMPAAQPPEDKDKPAEITRPTTPTSAAPEAAISVDDVVIEIDD